MRRVTEHLRNARRQEVQVANSNYGYQGALQRLLLHQIMGRNWYCHSLRALGSKYYFR